MALFELTEQEANMLLAVRDCVRGEGQIYEDPDDVVGHRVSHTELAGRFGFIPSVGQVQSLAGFGMLGFEWSGSDGYSTWLTERGKDAVRRWEHRRGQEAQEDASQELRDLLERLEAQRQSWQRESDAFAEAQAPAVEAVEKMERAREHKRRADVRLTLWRLLYDYRAGVMDPALAVERALEQLLK